MHKHDITLSGQQMEKVVPPC